MKRKPKPPAFLRARPAYCYFLFIPAYLLCFFLVERLVPPERGYWVSYLPLDDYIPFLEIFVVPYCLWYPLLLCTGLALLRDDVPELRRYMRFLTLGFGVSLLFCLLFPNGQDLRPAEFARDNLFTRTLGGIYAVDTNTNVLPSMHVVGCAAAGSAAFHSRGRLRRQRWPVLALCLLICASTVLVKQHSLLDLLAGAAVGLASGCVVYKTGRKSGPTP